MKKTIPFTVASKRMKYLRINLAKQIKDWYSKKNKTLLQAMKEYLNHWKDIPCLWIEDLILLRRQYSQSNSQSHPVPIKIPVIFFAKWEVSPPAGVSNLLMSLGHTGRRVVMGHTLNTQTLMKIDEQKKDFK